MILAHHSETVTQQEGLAREVELQTKPDFWVEMIEEGAHVARLDHRRIGPGSRSPTD